MNIKLIRDLNTERNKEQEDSFEKSMNLALYFDLNKSIDKFDGWKFSNVKRFTRNLNNDIVLNIYYSKWNENVKYLFDEIKPESELMIENLSEDIIEAFKNREVVKIHDAIRNSDDNPNMKFALLLLMAEVTSDEQVIDIINRVINGGITNPQMAIDMILPKLLMGGKDE